MLASEKDHILYEIASVQNLYNMVEGDPIMELPFRQKLEELHAKLRLGENEEAEACAILYFFGDPVKGSQGIEATFLSETLAPFQQLVSARVSKKWRMPVKSKGKIKDLNDSTLFLTNTPRGSFGVELRKLTNVHVSHESHLADALKEVVELIESSKTEETFTESIKSSTPREISAMKKLFGTLKKNRAGVVLETGSLHSEFTLDEVKDAFEIISKTSTDIDEVKIIGRFRGVLLDRRTYDFVDNSGTEINGPVHESLSEEELEEYNKELLDLECLGYFERKIVSQLEGDGKPKLTLKSLELI